MVFHSSLSDSKSLQVSRTLLSILAVFNNAVVRMVSTRPPTSKSSRPFNNTLVTAPEAPISIGIIVTFMFHSFFQFSSKVEVLISLFTFFQFYYVVYRDSIIIIIIIIHFLRFFHTCVNRWSFSENRVNSRIRDSSQYFNRSQQCYKLDGQDSSFDFQSF